MDVLFRNMFLAITVMLGIGLVHGYDSKSNFRKIDILETKLFVLETKLDVVVTELKYVKEDLKEEKDKFIRFENQLKDENIDSPFDDKDSDLTEHHSVEDHQQEVGLQAMSVEQRIYNAMKDEKNVRKQFEKQMKTDFMTANKHTEIKFTAFTETLAAVIDRKLDAIEDKVRTSVTVLNDASSSIANLTIKVQHNDDAITSLMLESDQLNTTILRYGTKIKTVEVDLANKVQQNDKSITSLMLESDQLNTTLFRYGIKLETIEVDLANNVEDLIDNSHRYKVCLHGGNHSTDGLCECTPPHYGNNCEKGCFNDGKYLEDGSCECSRLYVGAKCEKVRCFNGAKHSTDGTCECTMPYYGTHCEKGCFNDGKYLEDGSCECSRLYGGAKCEKVRCFNGAKHSEDGTCECTMPYYGTHCEKVLCFNGAKHSTDGTCECTMPYYGTHCEKGCFNDGKYLEDGSCECSRLYVGAKCEKVHCFNGAKHSKEGTCECTMPYYGTHCEKGCFNDGKYLEDGSCECSRLYVGAKCEKANELFDDCYDIHKYTDKPTGVYNVTPHGLNQSIEVKCDMEIDGGGWTVFQYRHDGSVDFFRKFDEYENGFGSLTTEFWLGLQYIHAMTSSVPSEMRIDVAAADGTTAYQTYDDFKISEGPDYRLNIGATSGTAGDEGNSYGISYYNGQPFSTYDRDSHNCAATENMHGGWWYNHCGYVNPNGEYPTPGTTSTIWGGDGGMIYYPFKKKESLKSSKIMFRRT